VTWGGGGVLMGRVEGDRGHVAVFTCGGRWVRGCVISGGTRIFFLGGKVTV
jgi:hypothetical protein